MAKKSLTIAVIGGSLTGLFCALTLLKLGHTAIVLERRDPEQLQDQGGGLRFGRDVKRFLTSLAASLHGELECFITHKKLVVYGGEGEIIASSPIDTPSTSWGCLFRALRRSFEQLATGTKSVYLHSANVRDVREDNGGCAVEFQRGLSVHEFVADYVVGADGASSRLRQIFLPDSKRTYAGYVVWRGLISESSLRGQITDDLLENRSWHFGNDYMVVTYSVPGEDNSIAREDWQKNWAWFHNTREEDLGAILTDREGKGHRFTVPMGKVRPQIIQKLKESAQQTLPPELSRLVQAVKQPFVQAVTDSMASENTFLDGRVLLVGEAVNGVRAHVGASTSQAIFHAAKLEEYLNGFIDLQQWSRETLQFSLILHEAGRKLGDVCQTPSTPHEKHQRFAAATADFQKALASLR